MEQDVCLPSRPPLLANSHWFHLRDVCWGNGLYSRIVLLHWWTDHMFKTSVNHAPLLGFGASAAGCRCSLRGLDLRPRAILLEPRRSAGGTSVWFGGPMPAGTMLSFSV
jgi:hypothetical protein